MLRKKPRNRILLIDDDVEFQRQARALKKLRFECLVASTPDEAIRILSEAEPELVLLDTSVAGVSGLTILRRIRELDRELPVIILVRHGQRRQALRTLELEVADMLEKPVNLDELASRIRDALAGTSPDPRGEPTIGELMVSPELYPRLYTDEPVSRAVAVLKHAFYQTREEEVVRYRLRSALVYDKKGSFLGIIRLDDILRLVHPESFDESPYMSFYTGMFLAQAKMLSGRTVGDLLGEQPAITLQSPLIEAVHTMLAHNLINLAVMEGDELVGVIRDKDIILEIARYLGV